MGISHSYSELHGCGTGCLYHETMLRGLRRARQSMRSRLHRGAFQLLYTFGAPGYNRFTSWFFLGEWTEWQNIPLRHLPVDGTVVELGCGTGSLAALGAKHYRWIGLDRSARMISIARKNCNGSRAEFMIANARRLPIRPSEADAVVATFPAGELISADVLAEIRRILIPEGRLIVILSGELEPFGWRRRWRRVVLRLFYGLESQFTMSPRFPGFVGTMSVTATPGGRALLYVGFTAKEQTLAAGDAS